MDLVRCKLCGERHRLGFCPEYADEMAPRRPHAEKNPTADRRLEEKSPGAAAQDQGRPVQDQARFAAPENVDPWRRRSKTRAPNGTFDRTAYQRELMRKRRAAHGRTARSPA